MKQDIIEITIPQQPESASEDQSEDELSSAILSLIQRLRDKGPLKQNLE